MASIFAIACNHIMLSSSVLDITTTHHHGPSWGPNALHTMKAMQVINPTMTSIGHNMNVTRAFHRAHGLTMCTGGAPADSGHTPSPRNDALRAQIREKSCSAALLDPADFALYQAQQCCSSTQTRRDSLAHRALRASPRAAASATHSLDPAGNAPFSHSSDLHMAAGIRQLSILPLDFRAQRTSGRLACLVSLVC